MRLKEFGRIGHWPTLLMAFLYFDISFMVWVLLGVLGSYIAADFGLSAAEKGLMVALPILGGALVRIPMGIMVDRLGPKKTGLMGQVLVMVPLVWAWQWGGTMPQVMALGLLLGVAGGSFAVALPLASRWYPPQRQGLAMGIAGAGNSGTVLTALLAPRLADAFGWHAVFGMALIPAVVVLALFAIFAKESPAQPAPRPVRDYLRLMGQRDTLWFSIFYCFTFGGFVGLASYLGIFFHDQYRLPKVTAGNLTALCVFAGSFLRPLGGYLADRFGGIRVLTFLLGTASMVLVAVASIPSLVFATVLLFATMGILGLGNGSVFQLVPQRFGKEIGVATGVIGAAGGVGGFLLPSGLGILKDATGTYGAGFLALSGAGLACLGLLTVLSGRWKRSMAVREAPLVEASAE
jgi:NNP family nitrate/nitrite transporter-like MFS transporter